MKKLFALLLVAVMCFSLVACGGGETPNNDKSQTGENTGDIESGDIEHFDTPSA